MTWSPGLSAKPEEAQLGALVVQSGNIINGMILLILPGAYPARGGARKALDEGDPLLAACTPSKSSPVYVNVSIAGQKGIGRGMTIHLLFLYYRSRNW